MDALTVLVLFIFLTVFVRMKLMSRRPKKQRGQDALPEREGGASMTDCKQPDFRILSFNTGDFTYTDDLAHCVEYELGKAIGDLKKEGCQLISDPFPIVAGCSLLVFLYYYRDAATIISEEVAG